MEHRDQLEWEARAGRLAAVAAFVAASAPIGGEILVRSVFGSGDGDHEALQQVDRGVPELIGASALLALGFLGLIPVLYYLYRATKYRRPQLLEAAMVLGVLGPVIAAVVIVWRQIDLINVASEWLDRVDADQALARSKEIDARAEDFVEDESNLAMLRNVTVGAYLAIAIPLVMISLNAMRVGLLSRFMGVVGIAIGIFYVLGGGSLIQVFWLPALGFLFLGRWPGGRGPAWETGEAEPWPTAQSRLEPEQETRNKKQETEEEEEAEVPATPAHPRSKKRRKRR